MVARLGPLSKATDELGRLNALLAMLAKRLEVNEEQTAPLARQYRDTLARIVELEKASVDGSVVDVLAARRQQRNTSTGDTAADGSGQK